MIKKHEVEKRPGGGFGTKPTPEYTAKQEREARIAAALASPKASPTNKDIQQLLLDIAARQSEIYDMLKQRT
ncbi:hypothetical protein [Ferviditalea candida]|uniref:Uncharacterized protein n=1 Tax=Ferviditalea candida TaxID=3108399 RepID=A0ABU5ZN39_9BACL|nr:hypothetical protein [Paenibacillaceae bacterium T2]